MSDWCKTILKTGDSLRLLNVGFLRLKKAIHGFKLLEHKQASEAKVFHQSLVTGHQSLRQFLAQSPLKKI